MAFVLTRSAQHLNSEHKVNVPFILMNSFNTNEDTERIIQKYANHNIDILTFEQSRYPRVNRESLLPSPRNASDTSGWYPPGHGDLYDALMASGLVDRLLKAGKEYLFVSNVDNLGAVVDTSILKHMMESQAEFLMCVHADKPPRSPLTCVHREVTDKTKADVKGGTLIDYEGQIRLLEIAQVPSTHVEDFKSVRKFKIFNTCVCVLVEPSILDAAQQQPVGQPQRRQAHHGGRRHGSRGAGPSRQPRTGRECTRAQIIVNNKVADNGEAVIQLETAVGAAIKHFSHAHGINVPRSRFLPVKSCSDLLLITSDLYTLEHGSLIMNEKRYVPPDDHCCSVVRSRRAQHVRDDARHQARRPLQEGRAVPEALQVDRAFRRASLSNAMSTTHAQPELLELDHLTVSGDVTFGRNVVLRGTPSLVSVCRCDDQERAQGLSLSSPTRGQGLSCRTTPCSRTVGAGPARLMFHPLIPRHRARVRQPFSHRASSLPYFGALGH
jgi:UTP--glucose-1-phosphate uridylyltransferase